VLFQDSNPRHPAEELQKLTEGLPGQNWKEQGVPHQTVPWL
jgi:hypothetical protein